jgi:hypothetical protein
MRFGNWGMGVHTVVVDNECDSRREVLLCLYKAMVRKPTGL